MNNRLGRKALKLKEKEITIVYTQGKSNSADRTLKTVIHFKSLTLWCVSLAREAEGEVGGLWVQPPEE